MNPPIDPTQLIPLEPLVDPAGRTINYLRVSITDRCNLRCVYCMPPEGIQFQPRDELLTYEETMRIIRAGAAMGLRKVRVTGGEPLVRHGIVDFIAMVRSVPEISDISLTTNGIALPRFAEPLAKAGLNRVNISLDTFRPDRFNAITRLGSYQAVLDGIDAARAAGLAPIKINVVVMLGVNDDEIVDFARATLDRDWIIRFIELMPFLEEQETCIKDTSLVLGFVPTEQVRAQIEKVFGPLEPATVAAGNGPARYFRIPSAKGTLGFISPVTEHRFCASCNRMRLTADGKIRPCLLTDHEVDLRAILRSGSDDDAVREGILQALRTKPDAHHMSDGNRPRARKMIQIGG